MNIKQNRQVYAFLRNKWLECAIVFALVVFVIERFFYLTQLEMIAVPGSLVELGLYVLLSIGFSVVFVLFIYLIPLLLVINLDVSISLKMLSVSKKYLIINDQGTRHPEMRYFRNQNRFILRI